MTVVIEAPADARSAAPFAGASIAGGAARLTLDLGAVKAIAQAAGARRRLKDVSEGPVSRAVEMTSLEVVALKNLANVTFQSDAGYRTGPTARAFAVPRRRPLVPRRDRRDDPHSDARRTRAAT